MKSFSFLLVTLGASIALAYPTIKDKADYAGIYTAAAGGDVAFTQSLELTAFDATKNEYTLRVSQTFNGNTSSGDQLVGADAFPTEQQISDLMTQCLASGGVNETTTVAAGTFATCSLPQENNGRIWIADVPFGFVKILQIDADGNKVVAELTSYARGN